MGLLLVLVVGVVAFHTLVPVMVDERVNAVVHTEIPRVTPEAAALHNTLFVADLHADELLWGRDLLQRVERGHVDLPRLQGGRGAAGVRRRHQDAARPESRPEHRRDGQHPPAGHGAAVAECGADQPAGDRRQRAPGQ
ncbi:MAG: hypothetical protein ACK6DP_03405 [Gemmatimonas sp.]|uniref:hypothetical protein n=1 Tax=Gemmatimonas sp. TaxID=1962908 RepID=UPI00391F5C81|nr:hypothetical protein [Gemmatimonadota bacterium]